MIEYTHRKKKAIHSTYADMDLHFLFCLVRNVRLAGASLRETTPLLKREWILPSWCQADCTLAAPTILTTTTYEYHLVKQSKARSKACGPSDLARLQRQRHHVYEYVPVCSVLEDVPAKFLSSGLLPVGASRAAFWGMMQFKDGLCEIKFTCYTIVLICFGLLQCQLVQGMYKCEQMRCKNMVPT